MGALKIEPLLIASPVKLAGFKYQKPGQRTAIYIPKGVPVY